MANLTEISQFDDGIRQIETTDPVLGGPDGIANSQGKSLANRTRYLKDHVDKLENGQTVPPGIATESYVQRQVNLLDGKQSVRVSTTAAISLSGAQTIDGVSVLAGDRVLVKNQADAKTNGIYIASGSTWSRAGDADENAEVTPGLVVYVEEGSALGKSRWQLTTPAPVILGTSSLTFSDITAGFAPLNSPSFSGTPTAPKAPQLATGSQIINADALKAAGLQASGLKSIDLSVSNVSLTLADVGSVVVITGSGGGSLTLPKASTVPAGGTVTVRASNTSVSTNTLKVVSGDTLSGALQSTAPAGIMRSGDCVVCVSDGLSTWHLAVDATYNFIYQAVLQIFTVNQAFNASAGYQRFPGGMILQTGYLSSNATSGVITYPVAYDNACIAVIGHDNKASPDLSNVAFNTPGKSSVSWIGYNTSNGGALQPSGFSWIAMGY